MFANSADYKVGISPALGREFRLETREKLRDRRYYRVREPVFGTLFELMVNLPSENFEKENSLIVHASGDMPDILARCRELESKGFPAVEIEGALHDIYTLEATFEAVAGKLKEWLK